MDGELMAACRFSHSQTAVCRPSNFLSHYPPPPSLHQPCTARATWSPPVSQQPGGSPTPAPPVTANEAAGYLNQEPAGSCSVLMFIYKVTS